LRVATDIEINSSIINIPPVGLISRAFAGRKSSGDRSIARIQSYLGHFNKCIGVNSRSSYVSRVSVRARNSKWQRTSLCVCRSWFSQPEFFSSHAAKFVNFYLPRSFRNDSFNFLTYTKYAATRIHDKIYETEDSSSMQKFNTIELNFDDVCKRKFLRRSVDNCFSCFSGDSQFLNVTHR